MSDDLPRTPRDSCRFRRRDALIYDGLIKLAALTGAWRHPRRAQGDLEHMRLLDKVYWLYKSEHPIRHAMRGHGLETYFARQPGLEVPEGFDAEAELRISAVGTS